MDYDEYIKNCIEKYGEHRFIFKRYFRETITYYSKELDTELTCYCLQDKDYYLDMSLKQLINESLERSLLPLLANDDDTFLLTG